MTDAQFDIINNRLVSIEAILFRAFAGNVPFENIVTQVRSLYDNQNANRPGSEANVPDNGNVSEAPNGDVAQTGSEEGADSNGSANLLTGSMGIDSKKDDTKSTK